MTELVLASSSLRRRELLAQLGLSFEVIAADIDESVLDREEPVEYVLRLSREKAAAIDVCDRVLVIAADTTVDVDGDILGKPVDAADARSMLARLSGRDHRVHTGVTVRRGAVALSAVSTTIVTFAALSSSSIEWYLATGEPFDKAGAYAIQGAGGALVAGIDGSVSNVIGLPLTTLIELTRQLGVELL
jgi:septum formation protein